MMLGIMPAPGRNRIRIALTLLLVTSYSTARTSGSTESLPKVMTLSGYAGTAGLDQDRGAAGLWQKLLKLTTTASAIHTTAHPDDEHGGVLTYLGRGRGARTALLTLNRGESGANAIGSELFDALGLIRTEELLLSDRYYGVDDQYFTTLIDYGYSKTLEESLRKWGKENVLRDVVRVIRINRPLVIISRFHGSSRDGHGNHQTAGVVSQEAFEAAGDPDRFPEQIREEGLRPWQPLKMYRGGFRAAENWTIRVNAGEYSPWLGKTYRQFASEGLALQRSQTSGRMRDIAGDYPRFYQRLHSKVDAPDRESGFFDGIDTSIAGIFSIVAGKPPKDVFERLANVDRSVRQAIDAFSVSNPSAVVPFLAQGLSGVRAAKPLVDDFPDALFMLAIKEKQFVDAIHCALGVELRALAIPEGVSASPFASPPTMGTVVPGQNLQVRATLASGGALDVRPIEIGLDVPEGWVTQSPSEGLPPSLAPGVALNRTFSVTVSAAADFDQRYFYRRTIQESRYRLRSPRDLHLPHSAPAVTAFARYSVSGVEVEVRETVRTLEANLPYGHIRRQLRVAPALAVTLEPEMMVAPLSKRDTKLDLLVKIVNNRQKGASGRLKLDLPEGWTASPASRDFRFSQAGESADLTFSVKIARLDQTDYRIRAVAEALDQEFTVGYQTIRHRDLQTRVIYRDAVATVRGIDVDIAPNLNVGYVMGVGDEVPAGIRQLGANVHILDGQDLATGDHSRFDAIVLGTRAYAVRDDLITYNQRLLDYARQGGNLIVLYNTPEFDPGKWAPYPATLPRRSEEVSEEDSPVKILVGQHRAFNRPNKIMPADFEGWIEQRGSKFFSEWDSAYTAMIETQDRGQAPQRGGWVTAEHGKGYYTYFAYAFHRQAPYGVPGAFRIFANLLSLGK